MPTLPTPLTLLGPLTLLTLSLPLLFFATITAALSFTLLTLRVLAVYLELGYGILRSIIAPEASPFGDLEEIYKAQQAEMAEKQARQRVAARRRIAAGAQGYDGAGARNGASTGASAGGVSKTARTMSAASVPVLENRDYEGVGGWRLPMPSTSAEEAAEDDAIWMGMNSRLELPTPGVGVLPSSLALASGQTTPGARRHRRTLTGGSQHSGRSRGGSRSPEQLRMSPVQSRRGSPPRHKRYTAGAKTPGDEAQQGEGGYFPTSGSSGSQDSIVSPGGAGSDDRKLEKMQSTGASSSGSTGSSMSTGSGLAMQGLSNTEG